MDDIIVYAENLKESTKMFLDLVSFNKIAGYMGNVYKLWKLVKNGTI